MQLLVIEHGSSPRCACVNAADRCKTRAPGRRRHALWHARCIVEHPLDDQQPCSTRRNRNAEETPVDSQGPRRRARPNRRRARRSADPRNAARAPPSDEAEMQRAATEIVAEAFPFNAAKPSEYGKASAEPQMGQNVEPLDPVGASTLSEKNASAKDRRATDARHESGRGTARPSARGFGRPRADDQPRRADRRQPELAQSRVARPDAARGLHPPREDHAFRSRADPRAHRACPRLGSARLLRVLPAARRADTRLDLCRGRQAHARLRALLDRRRRTRVDRYRARRARFRREVLYGRGQLGSRRQQHPGLLHPGCDEVSRPGPCREARAASRDAASRVRARHVLGFRVADAGIDPYVDVGHVRPSDSAQLPNDAGVSASTRFGSSMRKASPPSSSFTGRPRRGRIRWSGTRRSRFRAPIRISIDAISGKPSRPARIPSGSLPFRRSANATPSATASTCSMRPRSFPRSSCR